MTNTFNLNTTNIKSTGNYIEEKKQKQIYITTTKKAYNNVYDKNYGFKINQSGQDKKVIQTKDYTSLLNISKGKSLMNDNISAFCVTIGATDLSGCN